MALELAIAFSPYFLELFGGVVLQGFEDNVSVQRKLSLCCSCLLKFSRLGFRLIFSASAGRLLDQ